MMARAGYWNHNVHYQPVILRAVPPRCGPALDVGCGDGMLACRLAELCTDVTGIDRDDRMIALAKERTQRHSGHVTFVAADFIAYPLAEASFDFVCANTSLHHMDFAAALTAMARLLRPGGRLAVIGLACDGSLKDLAASAAGVPVNLVYRAVYHEGTSGAPIKEPDMTWGQVRATATSLLPGARYRRLLLWRYSLLWSKPSPIPRRRPGSRP
jgi:SAM-dependent methyltransferase